MKPDFLNLLALSFFAGAILFFQSVTAQSLNELYVSPKGDDTHTGTLEEPLATLQGAQQMVRKLKAVGRLPSGGVTVYFREGTYPITETVAFGPEEGGTAQAPITYRNYEEEKVSFSGGVVIPSDAMQKVTDSKIIQRLPEAARAKVWMADLKALGITEYGELEQHGFSQPIRPAPMELFVDGKPQTLARWPNEGKVEIGKVVDPGSNPREKDFSQRGGTFQYDYDRVSRWKEADDIWLGGIFSNGFSDDNLKVEKIDEAKHEIKVVQPHMYTIKSSDDSTFRGGDLRGYYAYNLLEEIDQPGEYYIDRETGKLYGWLPGPPEKSELVVSVLAEPMLAIEGASYLTFSGFTFEYGKGMGIYMEKGEKNVIRDCTFRNLGTLAIMMGKGAEDTNGPVQAFASKNMSRQIGNFSAQKYQDNAWAREAGKNHEIKNCQFYQLGTGGIILDGGDRKTLTPGENQVRNCEFYALNRWNKTYCPAIWQRGVGNTVSHNFIHDLPHSAILLAGNDHIIEYNEISSVCQEFSDIGAIYLGRNPSERGNIIRYNYFHHMESKANWVTAIYFDDGAGGEKVFGNVFYKIGDPKFGAIFIHGGHDHIIENNVFIECQRAIGNAPFNDKRWNDLINSGLMKKRLKEEVDITRPPYTTRYPELKDFYNQKERVSKAFHNVAYRCGTFEVRKIDLQDNFVTDENPGFSDMQQENFSLKKEAEVFKEIKGFQAIPFEEMGLQNKLE